jgi:hypothetical protein
MNKKQKIIYIFSTITAFLVLLLPPIKKGGLNFWFNDRFYWEALGTVHVQKDWLAVLTINFFIIFSSVGLIFLLKDNSDLAMKK